jgi:hypothetical protein
MRHGQPPVRQVDREIDCLLIEWHEFTRGYSYGKGYRASDSTSQDYRAPSHHDWRNGAEDARAERLRGQTLCECMDSIPNVPERWRTALETQARNLSTGYAVWTSPVLPRTQEEREILLMEARTKLLIELRRRDLI